MLRLALTFCAAASLLPPQATSAQAPSDSSLSYFPLDIGNSWTYMHVIQHPFMPWDTLYREVTIDEEVIVNDTTYFIVPLPRMISDTLRSSDSGTRIWMRLLDQDFLFYDFNVAGDSSYTLVMPGDLPDSPARRTELSDIQTAAGDFGGGIMLRFDNPDWIDDEFQHTFVAGVGLVRMSSAWAYWELASATVSGRTVTSTQALSAPLWSEGSVYPNPARNKTTLTVPSSRYTPLSVTAFDMLGRRIRHWRVAAACDGVTCHATLSIGDLAPGAYLLQASQGNQAFALPLIVQR